MSQFLPAQVTIHQATHGFIQNQDCTGLAPQKREFLASKLRLRVAGVGHKYDLKPVESNVKVHLTEANLQTVANAYLEFIEYLRAVHGADADTYAKEAGVRALGTVIAAIKSGKNIGREGKSWGQDAGEKENPLHSFKIK
ncbi:hypothetical protein VM1G_11427 [Cytospora mali]|uniref:Uncharacterized protein n=1 Tax=Cytospora mali TaxID=578113 RepID=A0A194VRU1_CYTMA|nr:hypothetical protein VM1G_11427 [Valsa mali]